MLSQITKQDFIDMFFKTFFSSTSRRVVLLRCIPSGASDGGADCLTNRHGHGGIGEGARRLQAIAIRRSKWRRRAPQSAP